MNARNVFSSQVKLQKETMNRITERHGTRFEPWAGVFSLLTICILIVTAGDAVWHQAAAQDSSLEPTTSEPNTSNAQPTAPPRAKKTQLPSSPLEVWEALKVFRYPLGLTSIVVVWFSIERLVVLRRGRVIPRHFVKRFFEHLKEGNLDPKAALKLCEDNGSPIALVLANGIRKWGKSSVEVEQAIIDGGDRQISQLRKHIRVLNGAASIAPLLGLFGTVCGLIESFNTISEQSAMGKSELLAGGIGLSLITTAAGLAIAIPALTMYMYFTGRVDALIIEMDGKAQELVDYISAEALAEQGRANPRAGIAKTEPRRAV